MTWKNTRAVVHTEAAVGTPERQLLVDQLKLRGVIAKAVSSQITAEDVADYASGREGGVMADFAHLPVANQP